jgi:hypothetical protein
VSAYSAGFGVYKCGGGLRCITFVPITIVTMRNLLRRFFCARKAWHKKTTSINSPVPGVMLALLLGINFLKNFGFSVVGNPALSTSSNSYVGAFFPGAFVGRSG